MSSPTNARLRLPDLQHKVEEGGMLTMLTSYDSVTAPLFDRAGIDMLLVGDSVGNVALGFPNTLSVTLEDMVRSTGAVSRSTEHALIVADLPFGTYEVSAAQAFASAASLIRAGAGAVKLEGGASRAETVRVLVDGGIPVMGHLGYTPQSEHALGGPRLQGRGESGKALLADAIALAEAGVFAVVLEMIPAPLAKTITQSLKIPTIGIGAGPNCNGQVLVWSDMAGMTEWTPSFVHRFGELGRALENTAREYIEAVTDRSFPGPSNYRS